MTFTSVQFPVAAGHPHPPDGELFVGSVVLDDVNVGTWRRVVTGSTVSVETRLAPTVDEEGRASVAAAVRRLADFLGLALS